MTRRRLIRGLRRQAPNTIGALAVLAWAYFTLDGAVVPITVTLVGIAAITVAFDLLEEKIARLQGDALWEKQHTDTAHLILTGGFNAATAQAEEAVARMEGMRAYTLEVLDLCGQYEGEEGPDAMALMCRRLLEAGGFPVPGEDVEYDERDLIFGDEHRR